MTLSCYCDDGPEAGDVAYITPADYSVLKTKQRRKCCSCGDLINVGDTVAFYYRYKLPDTEIELRIYGEDAWENEQGTPRAAWYHCEECADLYFSLLDLGFCLWIGDNMHGLLKEYHELYGASS